jgi:hypothetical protein
MLLGKEVANELTQLFAKHHYVRSGSNKFVEVPAATRGLPHGLTPGLHMQLEHVDAAVEGVREHLAAHKSDEAVEHHHEFTQSIVSLPMSPFTQVLRPYTDAAGSIELSRMSVHCPDAVAKGEAPLPMSTDPRRALLTDPLFARPSVRSMANNPFETPLEHMSSFWSSAKTLARVAQALEAAVHHQHTSPEASVQSLYEAIAHFVDSEEDVYQPGNSLLVCAALLLLEIMYPCTWNVNLPLVQEPVSLAYKEAATLANEGMPSRVAADTLSASHTAELREHWRRFSRDTNGAWPAVRALLIQILHLNGSFATTQQVCDETRALLEAAVKNAWRVHSPDGEAPPPTHCPASRAQTPGDVRAPHINGVFHASVGDPTTGEPQKSARGALVGVKPFQMRQIAALAMGAHLDGVCVQCIRNEGQALWRSSSAADIVVYDKVTMKERNRSAKSCSIVQTEADALAFGDMEDKKYNTALQREAWDANARYVAAACVHVQPPKPTKLRAKGDFNTMLERQRHFAHQKFEFNHQTTEYRQAKWLFSQAAKGRNIRPPEE